MKPEHYEELEDSFCSNFDGIIDNDVCIKLQNNEVFASYPGWNFYANVYFDKKNLLYCCDIFCYGSYRETIKEKTPKLLKDAVCRHYGYE